MKNCSKEIKGEKILLLGYGRENQSVERFLRKSCPNLSISIRDKKDSYNYLENLQTYDAVVRTPGIPPEKINAPYVTTAVNIFFSLSPGVTIAVTGTKGKSTTSALIRDMLKQKYKDVRLVGNIGSPVLDHIDAATKETIFVVELSSHQLSDIKYSPHVAVVLNIFPEHLDYYSSFEEYVTAKSNIVAFQTKKDFVVYDSSNKWASEIAQKSKGKKIAVVQTENDKNVEAALAVADIFAVSRDFALQAVATFKPLPHRLEFVGEFKGIKFYNDSLATIPEATIRALTALGEDVATLIAGGFDRGLDFTELGKFLAKRKTLKTLILFPDTGEKIRSAILDANPNHLSLITHSPRSVQAYHLSPTMEDAVSFAYSHTPPGKICLLSPAAASFNMFKDYADRGEQFKKWVKELG